MNSDFKTSADFKRGFRLGIEKGRKLERLLAGIFVFAFLIATEIIRFVFSKC